MVKEWGLKRSKWVAERLHLALTQFRQYGDRGVSGSMDEVFWNAVAQGTYATGHEVYSVLTKYFKVDRRNRIERKGMQGLYNVMKGREERPLTPIETTILKALPENYQYFGEVAKRLGRTERGLRGHWKVANRQPPQFPLSFKGSDLYEKFLRLKEEGCTTAEAKAILQGTL